MRRRRFDFAIVLFLFVSIPGALVSQEPQLSAGFKSGANLSWITGKGWQEDLVQLYQGENAPQIRPTLGAFVAVIFPSGFGGRAELLFTEHGGKITDVFDSDGEFTVRFSLLDVSIFVERQVRLGPGAVSVYLGPTLFLVQGDVIIESSFGGASGEEREPPEEDQILAASGGLGYQWPLGPGALLIDGRYTRGLTGYNGEEAYDNAVTVMLGYSFPF